MKKFNTRVVAEIALLAAFAYIIDLLQGAISNFLPFWPNGGSVGIAMIPIIVLAYRRGTLSGILGGLLVGLLDLMDGPSLSPMADTFIKQVGSLSFDYLLAWSLVGLAGLVKPLVNKYNGKIKYIYISLGALIAGLFRFLSLFLSGVLMWPNYDLEDPMAINKTKVIFSLTYNSSYMIPTIILTIIVLLIIVIKMPKIIDNQEV